MPRKQRFKPSRKPKPVNPTTVEETNTEPSRDLGDGARNSGEREEAAGRSNGHNGETHVHREDIESGTPGRSTKHETSVIEESEADQTG